MHLAASSVAENNGSQLIRSKFCLTVRHFGLSGIRKRSSKWIEILACGKECADWPRRFIRCVRNRGSYRALHFIEMGFRK